MILDVYIRVHIIYIALRYRQIMVILYDIIVDTVPVPTVHHNLIFRCRYLSNFWYQHKNLEIRCRSAAWYRITLHWNAYFIILWSSYGLQNQKKCFLIYHCLENMPFLYNICPCGDVFCKLWSVPLIKYLWRASPAIEKRCWWRPLLAPLSFQEIVPLIRVYWEQLNRYRYEDRAVHRFQFNFNIWKGRI